MENFELKIIIAGSGGQGIQFIGKFLATYFMKDGYNVTYIPSYGAEMRGGPTDAQVVVSNKDISLPVVETADYIILLSDLLMEKFASKTTNNTQIIFSDEINIEKIKNVFSNASEYKDFPVKQIAKEFGNPNLINIPMIYAFLKLINKYNFNLVENTLKELLEGKNPKLIDANLEFFKFLESNMNV